jgi:hypothetical protein
MRKVFCGRPASSFSGSGTRYWCVTNVSPLGANLEQRWRHAATFRNMRIERVGSAPGVGVTDRWEMYSGNVATGVFVSLSGTGSGSGITHGVSSAAYALAAHGTIQLRQIVTGSAASCAYRISIEVDGAVAGQSMHGGFTAAGFNHASATAYFNPLTMMDATANNPDGVSGNDGSMEGIFPIPGTVSEWGIQQTTAPGTLGSGKKRSYVLYYRAPAGSPVAQDGSGGTPDTRFSIDDDQAEGSKTGFTLAVAAGGEVWGEEVPSSTPAAAGISICSLLFTSTVDGYSIWANDNPTFATVNDNDYMNWPGNQAWSTTESDMTMTGPVTTVTLGPLYVKYGSTATRDLTLRKGLADSTLVAHTVSNQRGSDTTHSETLTTTDTWSWRDDDLVGGFNALTWAVAAYITPPPPPIL